MKKIVLIFLSVFLLSSCAQEESTHKIKIGVALYQSDDTFIGLVKDSIAASAKAYELSDDVKITVNFSDGAGNQSVQNEQVDDFISQGYDAICVNMVDRTAAAVIIDKAMNADIPVVFFNREPVKEDMMRWEKVFYVGANAEQSGEIQGRLVAEAFAKNRKLYDKNGDYIIQYVMLEGEPGHQDALLRTDTSIRTLRLKGFIVEKLANDTANWQRSLGKEKMLNWLNTFGDSIEVVFANNDDMAIGAIEALQDHGYNREDLDKYVLVVGIDAIPAAVESIKKGYLFASVLNDAEKQGNAIFEIAYSMITKQKAETKEQNFDGKYIFFDYTPVQQTNDW